MSFGRKKRPWWAPGGIAGMIMDAKGEWIQEGGKWVYVKKEDRAQHDADTIGRSYESPDYLNDAPGEPPQAKPKPVPMSGGPLPPDAHLAGRYQSPSYLTSAPVGPSQKLSAPAPAPAKPAPAIPKLGSVAPTMYTHKPDTQKPRAIPTVTTCTLCNGPVKDGECLQCSSKQCRGCGEMNFAMSKTCLRCGHAL